MPTNTASNPALTIRFIKSSSSDKALRNIILVRLLLNNIVDNKKLKESLNDELGKNLIEKLKDNKASKREKIFALNFLSELSQKTREELKGELWARIKR